MFLMFSLPLSGAAFTFAKIRPVSEPVLASAIPPAPGALLVEPSQADDEPQVTIGLKTTAATDAATTEGEAPVVLPAGYLVPDAGPEETAHAGH